MRFVAFLRAVNVGGRVVRMERLRALFQDLDLASVETFIASGNVVFESRARSAPALERTIEEKLRAGLGYDVATFVRSMPDLRAVADFDAFPAAREGSYHSLYVVFLPAAPSPAAVRRLLAFRSDADDFHVHGREAYWLSHVGMGASTFSGARLEKALGMPATARNVTTVRKLADKYAR